MYPSSAVVIFRCGHPRTPENTKGGHPACLTCHRERERARYWVEPEKHQAAARTWRAENRERASAGHLDWRNRNRERYNEYRKNLQRRKSLHLTTAEYAWVEQLLTEPCVYCGGPSTDIDHILAHCKGGPNELDNFAPACSRCNQRKHDRSLLDHLMRYPLGG